MFAAVNAIPVEYGQIAFALCTCVLMLLMIDSDS